MSNLQLTEKQKNIVISILRSNLVSQSISFAELKILIFGSRTSKDKVKKFSDLDIAIIRKPLKLSILEIATLIEQFAASDLPFKVDICNFEDLPDSIKSQILEKNIELSIY